MKKTDNTQTKHNPEKAKPNYPGLVTVITLGHEMRWAYSMLPSPRRELQQCKLMPVKQPQNTNILAPVVSNDPQQSLNPPILFHRVRYKFNHHIQSFSGTSRVSWHQKHVEK